MINTIKTAASSSAARTPTRSVGNLNQQPVVQVQAMTAEERLALMAELKLAQQADVAPLVARKQELEAELAALNETIQAMKPVNDSLAVFRAVRKAVKGGKKTLEDIAEAAGYNTATVEAVLTKHLTSKDEDTSPLFALKNGEYTLAPKVKKAKA